MSDDPSAIEPKHTTSLSPASLETLENWEKRFRIEHDHYSAIGRVAAAWAYFEATVDTATIDLAGLSGSVGVCFTSQIAGIGRKMDAYIALAREKGTPEPLVSNLTRLASEATAFAEKRNRVVHDVWIFDHPNPPQRYEASARKRVKLGPVAASTETLHKYVEGIRDLSDRFEALADHVAVPVP